MKTLSMFKGRIARLFFALILTISLVFAGGETRHVLAATAINIAAGDYHTCALTDTGGVKCWGANHWGQLGNGTDEDSNIPVNVSGLGRDVISISASTSHTCALMETGSVKCWGNNQYGQLGNGSNIDSYIPVDVIGLNGRVNAIAAGSAFTCALLETGSVKCWGYNQYGQLGNGSNIDSYTPVNVTSLGTEMIAVSARSGYACALARGGDIKCWGRNNYGQLGNGTNTDSNTPVNVIGISSMAIAITAGRDYACVLPKAGGVKCWGSNELNQLGDGTTSDSNTPVNVIGLSGEVTAIGAGVGFTCAQTVDGVKCWGGVAPTPKSIPGLIDDVTIISAGYFYACALTEVGSIICWGSNFDGQLGDGTRTGRDSPVAVIGFNGLTLLEHDTHLNERANAIDAALAEILTKLNAFDFTKLDVEVSSRASQASVDAISNAVGSLNNKVNVLDTQLDSVEQKVDTLQASLSSCAIKIALVPQGTGHNANSLEFYVHTTLARQRSSPETLMVWVGGEEISSSYLAIESTLTGVTWVMIDGYKWSDLKGQPLTVEVTISNTTCSDFVVIDNN